MLRCYVKVFRVLECAEIISSSNLLFRDLYLAFGEAYGFLTN